jgi:hypothetical protein
MDGWPSSPAPPDAGPRRPGAYPAPNGGSPPPPAPSSAPRPGGPPQPGARPPARGARPPGPPPGGPPPGRGGRPPGRGTPPPGAGRGAAKPKPKPKPKSKGTGASKGGKRSATPPSQQARGRPPSGRGARGGARPSSGSRPSSSSSSPRKRREPARWARLATVYDVDGPRIRLGILWFVGAVPAVAIGQYTAAAVYGVTAALAARQAATAWKAAQWQADLVAALALVPVVAALAGHVPAFGALALVAVVAMIAGSQAPAAGLRGSAGRGAASGALVAAIVPAALAAASVVLVRGVSPDATVVLIGLASVYEIGDYLVGSGGSTPIEGPLAGIAAFVVIAFPMALLLVEPFDVMGMALVGVAALCCPVGQWIASAALPSPGAKASALRRIDTLILLAPLWAAAAGALS